MAPFTGGTWGGRPLPVEESLPLHAVSEPCYESILGCGDPQDWACANFKARKLEASWEKFSVSELSAVHALGSWEKLLIQEMTTESSIAIESCGLGVLLYRLNRIRREMLIPAARHPNSRASMCGHSLR